MGLKLLVVTRIGFILAVLGVFIIVVSYFAQYDYALGIAFFIVGLAIFAIGSSIKPSQRH
jgi:drug/metabolite transporter (DMT)-like permease